MGDWIGAGAGGTREGKAMTISRNRPIGCHLQGTRLQRQTIGWVQKMRRPPSLLSLDVDQSAKHRQGNGRGGERQKLETLILILAPCLPTCPPSVFRVCSMQK